MKPLTIVSASAEMSPFSKSGGLGDVTAALPKHVANFEHHVISVTPYYGFMKHQDIPTEDLGECGIKVNGDLYPVKFKRLRKNENWDVYFVCNEDLFGRYQVHIYGHENDALRFFVFDQAVIELLKLINTRVDVIHCHDWHTGLIPNILATAERENPLFDHTATLFTIHNLPFQMQGDWWTVPLEKVDHGKNGLPDDTRSIRWLNFTRRGVVYADVINTVSVRYAREILTPEYGQGLDRLLRKREADVHGIINGIDYNVYNPKFDRSLWQSYDWNSLDKKHKNKRELQKMIGLEPNHEVPLIGLVHRLTEQKGFELIKNILPVLMRLELQMVIVGTGDRDYVNVFRKAMRKYPTRIAILTPFTEELGSRVYAGSDMFLMPSRYEPCGISQLISLRYGSIPIVHETGGLSDTITNFNPQTGEGTGFVFSRYAADDLLIAIVRALETYKYPKVWEHLSWQAMQESYSWDIPAQKYIELYRRAVRVHRQHFRKKTDQ